MKNSITTSSSGYFLRRKQSSCKIFNFRCDSSPHLHLHDDVNSIPSCQNYIDQKRQRITNGLHQSIFNQNSLVTIFLDGSHIMGNQDRGFSISCVLGSNRYTLRWKASSPTEGPRPKSRYHLGP